MSISADSLSLIFNVIAHICRSCLLESFSFSGPAIRSLSFSLHDDFEVVDGCINLIRLTVLVPYEPDPDAIGRFFDKVKHRSNLRELQVDLDMDDVIEEESFELISAAIKNNIDGSYYGHPSAPKAHSFKNIVVALQRLVMKARLLKNVNEVILLTRSL